MTTSFPFRVHITTLLVVIVVASCLLLATFTYYANKQLAEERAEQQIDGLINRLNDRVEQLMSAPRAITRVVSRQAGPLSLARARDLDARMTSVPFLAEMIKEAGHVGSIYIGYPNGDFFMVRQIDPGEPLAGAAPETRWLVRTVAGDAAGGRTLTLFQLDRDFSVLQSNSGPTDYDPRQRPWYQQARDSAEGIRTDPLLLANDQELGIIYAHPAPVAEDERLRRLAAGSTDLTAAVIGASVQLDSLSRVIARTKVTSGSEVMVFDSRGLLVAYENPSKLLAPGPGGASSRRAGLTDLGSPVVDEVAQQWLERRSDESLGFVTTAAGDTWSSRVVPLEVHSGPPLYLGVSVPESELYASVATIRNQTLAIALGFLVLMVPVMLAVSSAFARPIVRLNQEAVAIRRFDFAETSAVPSRITEIHDLSQSMGEMKSTIRRFIEINLALGSETNFEQLLSDLLRETIQAAKAGSGALYLTDQEEHLVLHLKGLIDDQAWHLLPSERALEAPDLVQEAVLAQGVVVRAIERQALDALGLSDLVLEGQDGSLHAIALPLSNRQGQVAGAMLLLSPTHPEPGLVDFVSALSASSTISLETRELIEAQKRLFEALIKLIADAIDAKSPYTGGHCARVPELTKLLAQAADAAQAGPFADFLIDEREWESIHLASWLHDCGKITTPEYVVDKATKLETVYDRIHEIRTRFEVLRRDAELVYWRGIANGEDAASLQRALDEENRQLDEDFAFVADCNIGSEYMAPERLARLDAIAKRSWLRTFDDRIGLSQEELSRKQATPAARLPVEEDLLSDRPDHQIARGEARTDQADNPWGFKLDVPRLLYNRGELYNLSIGRGTLTAEERFKINDHIVQTIVMLSELPLPKHLKQVPEIAGGHHEKMDGSGYPKRLKRDEMSVVARIMAIADIFEALTAVDRPYKKGKTISEALKIMSFMCKDQHIDPDLFRLFLESGVYRRYAERYLLSWQLDDPDIASFLKDR